MKRYALYVFLFALLFPVSATASSAPPLIRTIIVKHFSNSMGVDKSQEFINYFCDALRDELVKEKIANQVAEDALPVADADASNSLVIEGKFTGFDKGGVFSLGNVTMEIEMYRISDHALMKMTTPKAILSLLRSIKTRTWLSLRGERPHRSSSSRSRPSFRPMPRPS